MANDLYYFVCGINCESSFAPYSMVASINFLEFVAIEVSVVDVLGIWSSTIIVTVPRIFLSASLAFVLISLVSIFFRLTACSLESFSGFFLFVKSSVTCNRDFFDG